MLISSTKSARPGLHLCQVYGDELELGAAVGEFVRSGLTAGELIIVVTGSSADTVRRHLSEAGVDPREGLERSQIHILSLQDGREGRGTRTTIVDRLQSVVERRTAMGYAVARVVSEVDSLVGAETAEEMVLRERLGEGLVVAHSMIGLCLYDRRLHDADYLVRASAEHDGHVVPPEALHRDVMVTMTRLGGAPGLRVTGEVDLSNRAALAAAVSEVASDPEGDVVVDLSGTSFIDMGGLRVFAELARRCPSRRVVLRAPADPVRRMLQVAGWPDLPNLVVAEDGG